MLTISHKRNRERKNESGKRSEIVETEIEIVEEVVIAAGIVEAVKKTGIADIKLNQNIKNKIHHHPIHLRVLVGLSLCPRVVCPPCPQGFRCPLSPSRGITLCLIGMMQHGYIKHISYEK